MSNRVVIPEVVEDYKNRYAAQAEGITPNYLEIARQVYTENRPKLITMKINQHNRTATIRDLTQSICAAVEEKVGKGYVQPTRTTLGLLEVRLAAAVVSTKDLKLQ